MTLFASMVSRLTRHTSEWYTNACHVHTQPRIRSTSGSTTTFSVHYLPSTRDLRNEIYATIFKLTHPRRPNQNEFNQHLSQSRDPQCQQATGVQHQEDEEIRQRLRSHGLTRRERGDLLRRRQRIRVDKSAAFWRRKYNYRSKQVFEELIEGKTSPKCSLPIEDIEAAFSARY